MIKLKLPVIIALLVFSIVQIQTVESQQTRNQIALNIGVGKPIEDHNEDPFACNISFGYELTPVKKLSFFTLEPRVYTSLLGSTKTGFEDNWKSKCEIYALGAALAPRLTLSNDDRDFMIYLEYELSAVSYYSKAFVYVNNATIYSAISRENYWMHHRWRAGAKLPKILKDGLHPVGMGVWVGFTSIRMDRIIQSVTPEIHRKYFTNLPLDGEFGMTFYF